MAGDVLRILQSMLLAFDRIHQTLTLGILAAGATRVCVWVWRSGGVLGSPFGEHVKERYKSLGSVGGEVAHVWCQVGKGGQGVCVQIYIFQLAQVVVCRAQKQNNQQTAWKGPSAEADQFEVQTWLTDMVQDC